MNIVEFHREVLGRRLSTYQEVVLRAVEGLPLRGKKQRAAWDAMSGGIPYRAERRSSVTLIGGARGGKTLLASTIALWRGLLYRSRRPGDIVNIMAVAQGFREAQRVVFDAISRPCDEVESLKDITVDRKSDLREWKNGVKFQVQPCTKSAARGFGVLVGVCDEVGYWRTDEGVNPDAEIETSLTRGMATLQDALLLKVSTPYGKTGILWRDFQRFFSVKDSSTLVLRATTLELNPSVDSEFFEREKERDLEAYRREYLAEWTDSLSAFLPEERINQCVRARGDLPPLEETYYVAFVDPSGGVGDAFALAIAHCDGNQIVVDLVRAWKAPFNPQGVVEEACVLLKRYRVDTVTGDHYAGEWPPERFRSQGIAYESCSLDKSSLYLEAAPRFAAGEVEIPEDAALLRELRLLERRRGSAGRDRVDHPRREHDDLANSVAGALWLAARGTGSYEITLGPMREMAREFREMGGVFSSTPGERIASRFDW